MAQRTILYALKITQDGASNVRVKIDEIGNAADTADRKVKSLGTRMRGHLKDAGDEGQRLSKGVFGVAAAFTAAAVAIDKVLSGNREWDQATGILTKSLSGLRSKLAETFGPTLAGWLRNVMIGVAGIGGAIGAIPDAIEQVRKSMDTGKLRAEVAGALPEAIGSQVARPREMRIQGGINLDPHAPDRRSTREIIADAMKDGIRDAIKGLDDIARDIMGGGGGGGGAARPSFASVIGNMGPLGATGSRITATPGLDMFDVTMAATSARLERVGEEIPKAFDHIFKALDEAAERARKREENRGKVAGTLGGVSNVISSGGSFGSIGAMSGDPVIAAIGTIADQRDQLTSVIKGMDEAIVDLVSDLPRILLIDLPLALIRDFLPGLIKGLGQVIVDAFKSIFMSDRTMKDNLALGLQAQGFGGAAETVRNSEDVRVMGGRVSDGRDRPSQSRSSSGGGVRDVHITVVTNGRPEDNAREVARELRRQQGNLGTGVSLDPIR